MSARRIAAACFAAAGIAVLAAGPASAGEVNGNGQDTQGPAHSNSICAFSGLNDEITPDEPTRTQSYGTFLHLFQSTSGLSMKQFKELSGFPSPGDACKPTKGFEE